MSDDNILPFPERLKNAIDEEQWRALQGEFYLDCYFAQHGKPMHHDGLPTTQNSSQPPRVECDR